MDLNEKRLVLIAMSQIKRDDTEFLTRDIPITEFAQYLGGNPYQEARKAADGLLERVVFIQGEDGAYKKFQWTTLSEYVPAKRHPEGRACIRVRLNEELKPLLLQLKDRFNTIPLAELMPIPSFNSQRLYEVLWADSFAGKKRFLTYDIASLKTLLGLRDTEGRWEKYKDWRDFRKVLTRAQQDFDEFGALRIDSFKGVRQHTRSFDQVLFTLKLISQDEALPFSPAAPERSLEELQLAEQLSEAGFLQDAFATIDTYGFDLVEKTLKLAVEVERKAARSSKPIYNLGGLIASMLKGRVAERKGTDANAAPNAQTIRRLASSLSVALAGARSEHAATHWETLPSEERESLHDLMRVELEPMLLKLVEADDWSGPAYESARNSYVLSTIEDDLPPRLKSLDAFTTHEELLTEYEEEVRQKVIALAENDW